MTERKQDGLLDEYLRGDSPLTRAYRETAREEPSARLDAAILAQAKAGTAPRRGGKPRWLMPLSLAATVVLAVGVVLFTAREGGAPLPMETAPVVEPAPVPAKPSAPPPKVAPKQAPAVTPKEAPRFEPRVFTPKEPAAPKTPEQWLAEIEELRRAGRHAEAEEQMTEFRRSYPDYPAGR